MLKCATVHLRKSRVQFCNAKGSQMTANLAYMCTVGFGVFCSIITEKPQKTRIVHTLHPRICSYCDCTVISDKYDSKPRTTGKFRTVL